MKILGWVLSAIGIIVIAGSFAMPISAESLGPYEGGLLEGGVANLSLMATRAMVHHSGWGVLVVGVILQVGGVLEDALLRTSKRPPAKEAAPSPDYLG